MDNPTSHIELEVVSLKGSMYACLSCGTAKMRLRWHLLLTIESTEYYISTGKTIECCGNKILCPDIYETEEAGLVVARQINSNMDNGPVNFHLINAESGVPSSIIVSPQAIH